MGPDFVVGTNSVASRGRGGNLEQAYELETGEKIFRPARLFRSYPLNVQAIIPMRGSSAFGLEENVASGQACRLTEPGFAHWILAAGGIWIQWKSEGVSGC